MAERAKNSKKPMLKKKPSWSKLPKKQRPLHRKRSPPFKKASFHNPKKRRANTNNSSPNAPLRKRPKKDPDLHNRIDQNHVKPPNSHKRWTAKDDKLLVQMVKSNTKMGQIMQKLDRTKGAIEARIRILENLSSEDESKPAPNIRYINTY